MSGVNMIDVTDRIVFNNEFKEDYELAGAQLVPLVNTDGLVRADTAQWEIVGEAPAATERTRDGRINKSQLGLSKVQATLKEQYVSFKIDDFDIFRHNPNVRSQQVKKSIIGCNKARDRLIYDTLVGGVQSYNNNNAIQLNNVGVCLDIVNTLLEDDVDNGEGLCVLITKKAEALMLKTIEEFKNSDYTTYQDAMAKGVQSGMGMGRMFAGAWWTTWNGIDNKGTADAQCVAFRKEAMCHMDDGSPSTNLFYNDEDDYHGNWARVRHAAKIGLERGVIKFKHDDSIDLTA